MVESPAGPDSYWWIDMHLYFYVFFSKAKFTNPGKLYKPQKFGKTFFIFHWRKCFLWIIWLLSFQFLFQFFSIFSNFFSIFFPIFSQFFIVLSCFYIYCIFILFFFVKLYPIFLPKNTNPVKLYKSQLFVFLLTKYFSEKFFWQKPIPACGKTYFQGETRHPRKCFRTQIIYNFFAKKKFQFFLYCIDTTINLELHLYNKTF